MGWVYRKVTDRTDEHRCPVPKSEWDGRHIGDPGDLWRCDHCNTLWTIRSIEEPYSKASGYLTWRRANWRQRRKARRIERSAP